MELSSNLTLEIYNQPFLLEKRIELLQAIREEGSISKAAKAVPMSYKAAWDAVDAMNNLSHTPIVSRETGGKGGGGTKLTVYGENLLKTYHILKEEQKRFLELLNQMTDVDTGTLLTIGRLAMQISARNQLTGAITNIEKGMVNTQVFVKLKSGKTLISVITNNAAQSLDLKVDDEVTAIFKSNSVLLSSNSDLKHSARNQFEGRVELLTVGKVNAEVVVSVGDKDTIVSVITAESVASLGIEVGGTITAIIKSVDIMIGK